MAEECAFCGHPDSRHRLADAIASRILGGEEPSFVLYDHGWTVGKYMQVIREINEAEERVGWVDDDGKDRLYAAMKLNDEDGHE